MYLKVGVVGSVWKLRNLVCCSSGVRPKGWREEEELELRTLYEQHKDAQGGYKHRTRSHSLLPF